MEPIPSLEEHCIDLNTLNAIVERLSSQCTHSDASTDACTCHTALLSRGLEYLEQKAADIRTGTDMLELQLHKLLAGLVAALLKGCHRMDACRRATDAFYTLVASHCQQLHGSEQGSHATTACLASQHIGSHSSVNASVATGNSTNGATAGSNCSSDEDSSSKIYAVKLQVALELGRSGLLQVLQQKLEWLRDYFIKAYKHLQALLAALTVSYDGLSDSQQQQAQQQLQQRLKALKAALSPDTRWQLDSCLVLYRWASMLITIWPSDVLTAPAAAGVVVAAAEAAASHFQCVKQMVEVCALLTPAPCPDETALPPTTAQQQEEFGLCLAPDEGVAAALEFSLTFLQQLSGHIPALQQREQEQQQEVHEQQQQQQRSAGPVLAPCVLKLFRKRYRFLMPLCAAALGHYGLQLAEGSQNMQQQQQQQQQQAGGLSVGCKGHAGPHNRCSSSSNEGGGGACGGSCSEQWLPPSAAAAAATAAPPVPAAVAAELPDSPGAATTASTSVTAAARAEATEAQLLLSASRLYSKPPTWLADFPSWRQLLQLGWQDMGFCGVQQLVQQHVAALDNPLGATASSSSSSGVSNSAGSSQSPAGDSSACHHSSSSSSSSNGIDRGGGGSSSGGSRGSGSGSEGFARRRDGHGCLTTDSWQDCCEAAPDQRQFAEAAVKQIHALVKLLHYPLQRPGGSTAAVDYLQHIKFDSFAAAHNAVLPTLLLASAQAALQLGAESSLQLVEDAVQAAWYFSNSRKRSTDQDSIDTSAAQQQQQQLQQVVQKGGWVFPEAIWEEAGLVTLLLQQLLAMATPMLRPQQQQQQQQQGQMQRSQQGEAVATADTSQLRHALAACFDLLGLLVGQHELWFDCTCQHDCNRMALVLQTAEAVMRYFPAYVTRRKQQQQQHDGVAAIKAPSLAADAPSAAYTAAGTVSQQARQLFTDFVDTVSRMIDNMTVLIKRWRRKQRQQLLQVAQPVTQAALSLLLTAVKNRHLRGFTVFCQYIGWAAGDLLETWAPVIPQQTPQQQQQQQVAHTPASSLPARLQEPHPAAAALAGRYLLAVGKSLQRLAAAGDAERTVQWLKGHLVSGDAADGQPQQPGPLRLLLRDILKVEHFLPVLNTGVIAEQGVACASNNSSSSAGDISDSGADNSSRVEAVLGELPLCNNAGVVQSQLLGELLSTATDHSLACLEQVLSAEQCKQDIRENLSDLEATLDKHQKDLAEVRQYAATLPPRKRLSLRYMEGCQVKMAEGVQELQDRLAQCEHPHEVQKAVGDFGEVLYALGEALCAQLPTRFCCNNPHCDNVAAANEAFCLVRGAACVCGGCLAGSKRPTEAPTFCVAARYCSPACQKAHRSWHKGTCRMLRQAQGTGTAAEDPEP